MRLRAVIIVVMSVLPLSALAQSEAELKRYADLDQQCEAAREKKLAPLRAQKIDACVNQEKRSRADCESELGTFGNTRGKAGGGAIGGLFYDLPECVAATSARNQYRQ
jgi:hypothetical protein